MNSYFIYFTWFGNSICCTNYVKKRRLLCGIIVYQCFLLCPTDSINVWNVQRRKSPIPRMSFAYLKGPWERVKNQAQLQEKQSWQASHEDTKTALARFIYSTLSTNQNAEFASMWHGRITTPVLACRATTQDPF